MIVRNATYSDKTELMEIWKERFGDEDSFIDWFFTERFKPEHCSVAECDKKIVSCLYSIAVKIKVREREEEAILVSGVSTLPGYEGQGYMRKTMTYHLKRMKEARYNVSVLKAVKPEIYYSLEHQLINDVQMIYLEHSDNISKDIIAININEYKDDLYQCYLKFTDKYSGIIIRSYEDFLVKCREYEQTDGKCLACFNGNNVDAYCFFFESENKLYGEECIALSDESYNKIFSYIGSMPFVEKKVRVACDVECENNKNKEVVFGNSCYGMNISSLLSKTGLKGYAIEVIDNVIKENNGIFSLDGERINTVPSLRIRNGYLMQWIFGYKSMKELVDNGFADVLNDDKIVDYMDSLKKEKCYVIDEY